MCYFLVKTFFLQKTLGGLVNADLRFLESYGIDKRSFTLDEEQRVMQVK